MDPAGSIPLELANWSAVAGLAAVVALVGVLVWQWALRSQLAKRTRELRESESKYRGCFEHCQDAVLVTDPETGGVMDANPAAAAIYGYPIQELRGLSMKQVTTNLESAGRAIAEVMRSDRVSAVRCEHLRKGGERFPVEINATTAIMGGRRVVLSFVRDISERVRAERALLVDQENYRNIFNGAGTGILVVGVDSLRVLDANGAAAQLCGVPRESLVGSDFAAIFGPARGPWDWGRVAGRHRHTRKDSTCFECEVRVSSVDFMNQPAKLLLVQDITAGARAEAERRGLEAQLLQAQKLEGLGLLAGGIAHDFNNLLVGIMGNADIAASEPGLSEIVRGRLGEIRSAGRYASELTQQLLAYAGKVRFRPSPIDLAEVCADSVRLLGSRLGSNAQVRVDVEEGTKPVNADPTLLRQVVTNLLVNASDALGGLPGVVSVRVGMSRFDADYLGSTPFPASIPAGDFAWIEIADTGCGIGAAEMARIFDPFVSTKMTGRGLGLAVALSVVQRHRGAIKVASEVGKGTSFRVLLPVGTGVPEIGELRQVEKFHGPAGRAIVADDEPRVLDVTCRLLESRGWAVVAVSSGEALIGALEAEGAFDVAVTDAIMPGIGGAELVREVRRIRPNLAVVTVSGYSLDPLGGHGTSTGADAFVQKPFTIDELLEGVAKARARACGPGVACELSGRGRGEG